MFAAQSLGKVVGFFYTIFLARNLGVSDFGLYSTALAFFSLISAVADFGFNRFLIREIARDRSKSSELLFNVSILRLTLTSVLFALFALILSALDSDKIRVNLTLLAVLAVLPQSLAFTFDAIFVAFRKLQISAAALFLASLFNALIGFYLINSGFGVRGSIEALILSQLIYAGFLGLWLKSQRLISYSKVTFEIIKKVTAGSLPYGLLGILGLIYFRIDTVLLSYLRGNFETGLYGAAYKFLDSIVFIPSALSMAMFPVLAKLHDSDLREVKRLYWKSLKIMSGLGLLVFVGYILILPLIIRLFLPQYSQSVLVVQILSLSIPFMFMHVPAVQVLFSTDKYLKQVILISIVTLIFNIGLNLLFIPQFGLYAAAWITSASEMLSFVIFFIFLKAKILKEHERL